MNAVNVRDTVGNWLKLQVTCQQIYMYTGFNGQHNMSVNYQFLQVSIYYNSF